jgi:hypothetical protein
MMWEMEFGRDAALRGTNFFFRRHEHRVDEWGRCREVGIQFNIPDIAIRHPVFKEWINDRYNQQATR